MIGEEEIKVQIGKMKNGKQSVPDGIKNEMYNVIGRSNRYVREVCRAMNGILEDVIAGSEWKRSNTRILPKVKKSQVKEHRPIALTNAGYKLFMSVLKRKMVEQELNDIRVKNMQAGFTEGRRMSENLFLLQYFVEECFRKRRQLIVVSVDFCKAFDSVDRGALVETLMFCKYDPRLIEVMVGLYLLW